MSEDGIACVKDHKDEIKECIEEEIPDLKDFDLTNPMDAINPEKFGINKERCK